MHSVPALPPPRPQGRGALWAVVGAVALVAAIAGCGRQHGDKVANPNPNAPTAVEQQAVFSSPQFAAQIMLHVPADDVASSQVVAAQRGPWEWWSFNRSNISCAQQGYAANLTSHPYPTADGYTFDGDKLEAKLERAGVRTVMSYTVTLNPTPWGAIPRTFLCLVNTPRMMQFAQGQDVHGALAIPIGQRICSRWTYANHYQSATPGQGNVQVFAGTFAYLMKSLVKGAVFPGQGSGTVKMYLNPDNGQWTITELQLHDPPLTFVKFSRAVPADPPQTSCSGP